MNATVMCKKCGKPLGMFDGNICYECEKGADRMKLIIDIPEDVYKKIVADKYAIYDKMFYSIKNGIPIPDNAIPDNATNGNSVIKMFFKGIVRVNSRKNVSVEFNKNWWNAPYQKGGKE